MGNSPIQWVFPARNFHLICRGCSIIWMITWGQCLEKPIVVMDSFIHLSLSTMTPYIYIYTYVYIHIYTYIYIYNYIYMYITDSIIIIVSILTVVIITMSLLFWYTFPGVRHRAKQVQKVLDVNKNGLLSTTEFSPCPQWQLASVLMGV
jgi:hypothetical protein